MKCMPQDRVQTIQIPPVRHGFWQGVGRFVLIFCLALTLNMLASPPVEANPKYASIIIEESSGKVLYSRNADKQLYPASLTKIMTLYLLFEALQNRQVPWTPV